MVRIELTPKVLETYILPLYYIPIGGEGRGIEPQGLHLKNIASISSDELKNQIKHKGGTLVKNENKNESYSGLHSNIVRIMNLFYWLYLSNY